jgi:hypothetical protein
VKLEPNEFQIFIRIVSHFDPVTPSHCSSGNQNVVLQLVLTAGGSMARMLPRLNEVDARRRKFASGLEYA